MLLVVFLDVNLFHVYLLYQRALMNDSLVQIQGTGTSANILQADIPACNSNVIHIMDGLLLPFAA